MNDLVPLLIDGDHVFFRAFTAINIAGHVFDLGEASGEVRSCSREDVTIELLGDEYLAERMRGLDDDFDPELKGFFRIGAQQPLLDSRARLAAVTYPDWQASVRARIRRACARCRRIEPRFADFERYERDGDLLCPSCLEHAKLDGRCPGCGADEREDGCEICGLGMQAIGFAALGSWRWVRSLGCGGCAGREGFEHCLACETGWIGFARDLGYQVADDAPVAFGDPAGAFVRIDGQRWVMLKQCAACGQGYEAKQGPEIMHEPHGSCENMP